MSLRFSPRWLWLLPAGLIALAGIYALFTVGRPAPAPVKRELYEGVTYRRIVRYLPHAMIAHVVIIDRRSAKAEFFVTPPDEVEGGALKARTTSEFLEEFGAQIAVNGDGFFPWWSRSPVDYYPRSGDPVTPNGFSAFRGKVYADGLQNEKPEPTLYITRRNELIFLRGPGRAAPRHFGRPHVATRRRIRSRFGR